MNALKKQLLDLTERYQGLPATQRLLLTAAVGAGVLALVLWAYLGGTADYGVLFSNLTQEDAAAIASKLKSKKIHYKLDAGGGTILVPRSDIYEMRLSMAGEGLPKGGGVGFELFDRQGLGTTDFVQRLNYQRALQGELARTISGIPEVMEARVHIVTPKESLFVEDQKKASAAIAVKLRRGRTLSPAQVDGIVNLVSSAVPDLHPSQVTVVDLQGRILSKPQDTLTPGGLSTTQMTFQRQAEESLERKVQSLFDQVLGPRKSIVRVAADLDFQKIDVREESFTPNKELVRSEQKTMERSSKGGEGAAGDPAARFEMSKGTIAAPPPGKGPPPLSPPVAAPAPTIGAGMERQSELRNYEINRVLKQVVDQPGKIKRLSVAVVVDGIYKGKGNAFTPRPVEEMRQFSNLAKKAIGFSVDRGDQFEISSAPLALQTPEGVMAAESAGSWKDTVMDSVKIGALVLIALAVLMYLLKKRPVPAKQPPLLEAPPAPGIPAYESQAALAPGGEAALPPPLGALPPPITLPDAVDGKEKIVQLINTYPDRAVEVLRLWLHEK